MRKHLLLAIMLLHGIIVVAQTRQITGTVSDKSGNEPLIGVTVVLKGTQTAGITDDFGIYYLQVPETGGTLIFS